ncbi:MAG: hypothetical protein ACXW1C_05555, partial [Gallionella sp.]
CLLMLGISSIGCTSAVEKPTPTLNTQELAAVIGEIKVMIKTDENLVEDFVVTEATPERIARFFAMPDIAQQPQAIRENALFFAGKSTLLNFDKPSDLINKVSAWFPQEVAAARAKQREFLPHIPFHLYGPYPSWHDEPAAFVTLWNCMPRVAWTITPTQNPFMGELNTHNPFMSLTDYSSGRFNFGRCVRENSSRRHPSIIKDGQLLGELDPQVYAQEKRTMGNRVAPILQSKFARFLATNRCSKTGADDCVLNLLMWSSLSPDDVKLAHALQNLEADIAPDSPLPALQTPSAQNPQGYEARFDEYLRRNAFLRAKFISVLSAKQAWADSALPTTLQQITHLQQQYSDALATVKEAWRVSQIYEIGYRNKEINPRYALTLESGQTPAAQTALLAELSKIDNESRCDRMDEWLGENEALRSTFLLHSLGGQPLHCVAPNWELVKQGASADMLALRNHYLDVAQHGGLGIEHEKILTQLTDFGVSCFSNKGKPAQDWLREACKNGMTEPQQVPNSFKLKHSHLRLNKAQAFRVTEANPAIERGEESAWLMDLAKSVSGVAASSMVAFNKERIRRNIGIESIRQWTHPKHKQRLIELRLGYPNQQQVDSVWPYSNSSWLLLVVDAAGVGVVGVPRRFSYQYDDGSIAHVSDLDNDGNLEVWFSGTFGECDGEGLRPGIDCAIETTHLGEISGNALSYFVNTTKSENTTNAAH